MCGWVKTHSRLQCDMLQMDRRARVTPRGCFVGSKSFSTRERIKGSFPTRGSYQLGSRFDSSVVVPSSVNLQRRGNVAVDRRFPEALFASPSRNRGRLPARQPRNTHAGGDHWASVHMAENDRERPARWDPQIKSDPRVPEFAFRMLPNVPGFWRSKFVGPMGPSESRD